LSFQNKLREDTMRISILALAIGATVGLLAAPASAQTSTSPTGPAFSWRYFTTPLEKDGSRIVQAQQQLHLPNRAGNPFHRHNGDQWQVVLEGEITFTVRGQPPKVLKAGEFVYIPRGTIHRNENKSNAPTRTLEMMVRDKEGEQSIPVAE
jgi:quercetin dioxygenase-like cupin family protein